MRLYIVDCGPLSPRGGDHAYALISEVGELLAQHICSDISWAMGDLEGRRPERQAQWRERYGDYEVLYIGDDEMTESELQQRHRKWADGLSNSEGEEP